jgi:rare lipoprotein A
MTAAHKTLPFGTEVKVTNLDNGKSVTVRINDRGPFVSGRIIDLTRAAFSQIARLDKGLAKVEIRSMK